MTADATPPALLRLATDTIPERDRLPAVHDLYGRTILKVDLDPLAPGPVSVDMTMRGLPGLGIATGHSSQMRVHHSKSLIDNDDLILLAALSGNTMMKHRGREEVVDHGQALLMTGEEVGLNLMRTDIRFVNVSFSRNQLLPLIGDLGPALMRPLAMDAAAMRLLVDYVQAIQSLQSATPETWHLVATHIFDLAALAIGATRDAGEIARGRGVRVARLRAIKADLVARSAEEDIRAADVARRHGLSERYLRKLFESDGTSLTDFVLGQRLTRAHRMLSDPRCAGRSITAIALEVGFNDLSYFNRTFRRRYGATPSDVRAGVFGA